ncbi:MAG: hypothetical protein H0T94_03115 [Acidimicrobiia bacterium]|nr:hypothetical protein [Acidimicrobiia bacterium]
MTRRGKVAIGLLLTLSLVGTALMASAARNEPGLRELKDATAPYRDVAAAESQGYEAFLECFDSEAGGMGQHYVNLSLLDAGVSALQPESLVYEVGRSGQLTLVAVEYIVPGDFVDPLNPPVLFGRPFHLNAALGVWVLHAWIWKANPSGTFMDWNPSVARCP